MTVNDPVALAAKIADALEDEWPDRRADDGTVESAPVLGEAERAIIVRVVSEWGHDPVKPVCRGCGKDAEGVGCYAGLYDEAAGETAADYVRNNEGTYNPETGGFLCDPCYIKAGQPSSPTGWRAP